MITGYRVFHFHLLFSFIKSTLECWIKVKQFREQGNKKQPGRQESLALHISDTFLGWIWIFSLEYWKATLAYMGVVVAFQHGLLKSPRSITKPVVVTVHVAIGYACGQHAASLTDISLV